MCGIFGQVGLPHLERKDLTLLVRHAQQRGRDSSGLVVHRDGGYSVFRAEEPAIDLLRRTDVEGSSVLFGHSRLVTNGVADNQPVVRGDVMVVHNGIVVNHAELWAKIGKEPRQEIDTEVIAGICEWHLETGGALEDVAEQVIDLCEGVVACAVAFPTHGKLLLFSNNGSLYIGAKNSGLIFASESFPLEELSCTEIRQVRSVETIDIPRSKTAARIHEHRTHRLDRANLLPNLVLSHQQEKLLVYPEPEFRRCTRCILPETMPFIRFDGDGVCNYCAHYRTRNQTRPKEELYDLVAPYRRPDGNECIVPFSGGRDSSYALHLIVTELGLRPLTYTYDWGMVTDLGRRNISRMSGKLEVENIIVADDIHKKRDYIARNLRAWLKSPNLGMLSILTAGDKHFFRHVETIKAQTGIDLNLWGINPLEVTHFKAGFLGVPPDFEEERVYSHGAMKQLRYQSLRFRAMLRSPGYFNRSVPDTLLGEYYRSFAQKSDYFHIFDYWRWDEGLIDETLGDYDWERAPDTSTTWRIGDGTAAFYNYAYYTIAGFTEHDTFRSNQVREGEMTRERALELVAEENRPRYPNLRWYLDTLGMDFEATIRRVNEAPRLYTHA